jgi:hypothetical protein
MREHHIFHQLFTHEVTAQQSKIPHFRSQRPKPNATLHCLSVTATGDYTIKHSEDCTINLFTAVIYRFP